MGFMERLIAPSSVDAYWVSTARGGLNECIEISGGSCIPNCVGYAWGRVYEITGKRPALSKRNAEDWYAYTADGYARGTTPKVGAVICWRKGKAGYQADGAGHVAVVERVNADGSILTSNSNYKGTRFYTRTFKPPYYSLGGAYTFQGFIYASGNVASYLPQPVARDESKDQIEITSSVVNCRIYPGVKSRSWGMLKAGIYNVYREHGVTDADGYAWYCISPDVNGDGDRAWVAYSPDWATLHLADTGNATLEAEIAQLRSQLDNEKAETTRLAKIVETVRAAVA